MTRPTRRQLKRQLENLEPGDSADRPDPLTSEEKAALDDVLGSADPWSERSEASRFVGRLYDQFSH